MELGLMLGVRAMDLGIDRLIEMFEQRFGRPIATGLLAVVGLGVAGLALHTIYDTILLPLASGFVAVRAYIAGMKSIALPSIAEIISQALVGLVAAFALAV